MRSRCFISSHFSFDHVPPYVVMQMVLAEWLRCLKERWRSFLPSVQLLLWEHQSRYGLEAADHATFILERALAQ